MAILLVDGGDSRELDETARRRFDIQMRCRFPTVGFTSTYVCSLTPQSSMKTIIHTLATAEF